jgi:hypothetical protein
MLGAGTAGELTGRAAWSGSTESAGPTACACGAAIKDRFATLDCWALRRCSRGSRSRSMNGSFVDRARTGLRHHNAPDRWDRRRGRCGFGRCLYCLCRRSGDCRRSRSQWNRSGGLFDDRCCHGFSNRSGRCRSSRNRSGSCFGGGYGRRHGNRRRRHMRPCNRSGRFRRMRLGFLVYGRSHRRLDDNGARGRNDCDSRAHCRYGSLRDNWSGRRFAGDGARSRRRVDDRGRRPCLGNNLPRFRTGNSGGGRCSGHNSGGRRGRRLHHGRSRSAVARWRFAGFCLSFLFPGQNGLHHVARLGDMREIDFRRNALGATSPGTCTTRTVRKLSAHLFGFVFL